MTLAGLKEEQRWVSGLVADYVSGASLTLQSSSLTATSAVVTTLSGTTIWQTQNQILAAGSPYGYGTVIQLTARSNISGGMWVTTSGNLAVAGPASALTPLGVAMPGTNVASGGTVNVIIQGVVPMIAEGTVLAAGGVEVGAGAALNTVKPHAAGSGASFPTLSTAGSEGVVFVLIR